MRKMVNTRGTLTMLPSEYFDRNVKIGSSNTRRRELGRRYEIGVGNIMWGNDFPHPEGTWPYTREFLKDRFWDIPIDETEQILGLNQAEFYGFDLDKLQPIADRIGPTPEDLGQTDPSVFAKWDALQEGGAPVAHRRGSRRPPHRQVTASHRRTRSPHEREPLDPGAPPGRGRRPSCRSRPTCASRSTYLTDPEIHAAVLPPPLTAPPEPRVRVHFTRIEVNGKVHEIVNSFLLDAMYGDTLGQFCAVMPIDLETAVTPSRETYGEPKKLAQLECEREGDHIRASVTRQGVTIIEVVGDVTEKLAVPAPYEVRAVLVQVPPRGVG